MRKFAECSISLLSLDLFATGMMKDVDRMPSKVQTPRILTSLHTDVLSQILVHVNNTDLLTVMLVRGAFTLVMGGI